MTENPAPVPAQLRLQVALRTYDARNAGLTIRTDVPGIVELLAAVRAVCEEQSPLVPPDGAAAALKALVDKWRQQANAFNNIEPLDHRAAQVFRWCADELDAALAALPEARRQEEQE